MTTIEAMSLEELAPKLGAAYRAWKEAEASKNECKDRFFALADEVLRKKGLAFTMVDYPAKDEGDARERVELHHPGWEIQELRRKPGNHPGIWQAVIIENPTYKPFVFEHEGVKYARSARKGDVMVDDDWLRDEEPELYEAVTFELPWGERVTRPVSTLDAELIGRLTKYIYNGKPRMALAAPRALGESE